MGEILSQNDLSEELNNSIQNIVNLRENAIEHSESLETLLDLEEEANVSKKSGSSRPKQNLLSSSFISRNSEQLSSSPLQLETNLFRRKAAIT